jgi:hypothetical protein
VVIRWLPLGGVEVQELAVAVEGFVLGVPEETVLVLLGKIGLVLLEEKETAGTNFAQIQVEESFVGMQLEIDSQTVFSRDEVQRNHMQI